MCLLEFEEDEGARKMPCEHLFHSGCILPWLGKVGAAPFRSLQGQLCFPYPGRGWTQAFGSTDNGA